MLTVKFRCGVVVQNYFLKMYKSAPVAALRSQKKIAKDAVHVCTI